MLTGLFLFVSMLGLAGQAAQGREIPDANQRILSERERPAVVNKILRDRLDNLLPRVMRETGIDMWLVINREYVEDPVYLTGPATLTQQWDHRPDLEFSQDTGACDPEVARRYKDSVPE